jgi:hypothetical protein
VLAGDADARHDVVDGPGEGREGAPALDERGVARVQAEREWIGQDLGGAEGLLELATGGLDVGHGDRA